MNQSFGRFVGVQAVSVFRLFATLVFATVAFSSIPTWIIAAIYISAALSDVLDGLLARRLAVSSFIGKVIDLISDKSLTVVSLLYAAAQGVTIFPLAIIAVREMVVLGARLIAVDGSALLPTSRVFGGVMAALLWGNTVLLLVFGSKSEVRELSVDLYWVCAAIFLGNLFWRTIISRHRIRDVIALELELGGERRRASEGETRLKE